MHVYAASGFFLHNMGVSSMHYIRHQQYCSVVCTLGFTLHVDLLPKFKLSAFSFRLFSCAGLCTGFTSSSWYSLGPMSNCSTCSVQLNRQKL